MAAQLARRCGGCGALSRKKSAASAHRAASGAAGAAGAHDAARREMVAALQRLGLVRDGELASKCRGRRRGGHVLMGVAEPAANLIPARSRAYICLAGASPRNAPRRPTAARVACTLGALDRRLFLSLQEEEAGDLRLYDVGGQHPRPAAGQLPLDDPRDHALQLDSLAPWLAPGASVLDCGSGSGYLTAALAALAAARARSGGAVVAVERSAPLQEASMARVAKALTRLGEAALADACVLARVTVLPADGADALYLPGAPFDAIRVGFALPALDCAEAGNLLRQLRRGGRMVAHLQGEPALRLFDKDAAGAVHVSSESRGSARPPPLLQRRVSVGAPAAPAADTARRAERDLLLLKLQRWRDAFAQRHARKPTRHDMAADAEAAQLFQRFAAINQPER